MERVLVTAPEEASRPVVSVVMTVFDEEGQYLERAIESVLNQTFGHFEFVIVDDGSGDTETCRLLDRAASRDSRVRLFRQEHRGLSKALNRGLTRCRGEFICRQDSDDWSEPQRLARQVDFLERNPAVAIVGSYVRQCRRDGHILGVFTPPTMPADVRAFCQEQSPYAHGSVCFRRTAIEAIGGYRSELACCQDWDCFWRMLDTFDGANIPEVLYNYRFTARSMSALRWKEQAVGATAVRTLADRRRTGEPENVEQAVVEARARFEPVDADYFGALRAADHKLLAGDSLCAIVAFVEAIRMHPAKIVGWRKLARAMMFIAVPPLRKRLFAFR